MTTLAEWLRAEKMTQSAFAQKVGLTQGRVSQIARGGTGDLITALKIEAATNNVVKVADLVPRQQEPAA